MKIYGLKNCDTCRKAAKALGARAELVDVRDTPLPRPVVMAAEEAFGEALVNKRSTTWRNLSETERSAETMTLIYQHPAVMKRPLIVDGDQMWLGFTAEVKTALGVS